MDLLPAAWFALALRDGPDSAPARLADLAAIADRTAAADEDAQVRELGRVIRAADELG